MEALCTPTPALQSSQALPLWALPNSLHAHFLARDKSPYGAKNNNACPVGNKFRGESEYTIVVQEWVVAIMSSKLTWSSDVPPIFRNWKCGQWVGHLCSCFAPWANTLKVTVIKGREGRRQRSTPITNLGMGVTGREVPKRAYHILHLLKRGFLRVKQLHNASLVR